MNNKLQTQTTEFTPIVIDQDTLTEMQTVIDKCTPIVGNNTQTFTDSVVIANGMLQLREFMNLPDVRRMVESMANTEVGFLTDRPPGKEKYDKRKKKYVKIVPYTYDEIVNALIPPMLEGYRFTGNEINIISYKGMPVKKGKFRKINDFKGVTDFNHSIGTPHKDYFDSSNESGVAKMKCQASWKQDGSPHTLGYGEDVCIIAVEFDRYSGIDKMIGLADSKVFSRVLTRLTGKFTIEGESGFEDQNTIDITPSKLGTEENINQSNDKRPLPNHKRENKPVTKTDQVKGPKEDGWKLPENEEGLKKLFDEALNLHPEKQKDLELFLSKEPIQNRPVEFYQDFVDGLKNVLELTT